MKPFFALIAMSVFSLLLRAEVQPAFPLWPDKAPGALGNGTNDIPTLTAYLPSAESATGAAGHGLLRRLWLPLGNGPEGAGGSGLLRGFPPYPPGLIQQGGEG